MSKTFIYAVNVHFGDCDPAGIVFFPNYSRWMDAATHHFFEQCGLPPWHAMADVPACMGPPLLEIHTRFHTSVTYGERIEIHTSVDEWRAKAFIVLHRVMRGNELVCEGRETRVLCVREAGGRIKAIPVPGFIREACT